MKQINLSSLSKETQLAVRKELAEGSKVLETIQGKIEEQLKAILPPQAYLKVTPYKSLGGKKLAIEFAASDYQINNVRDQRPQAVSLSLDEELNLQPQIFGGMGGRTIDREVDPTNPAEKWLAMKSITIPFRKPQQTEAAVLKAIQDFAKRWLQAMRDNKDALKYKDLVDYDSLLK